MSTPNPSTLGFAAGAAAIAIVAAAAPAPVLAAHAAKTVHCYGVNTCKGTSDCKSGNHECKGMNECKGQGFKELSLTACKAAGGSTTAK